MTTGSVDTAVLLAFQPDKEYADGYHPAAGACGEEAFSCPAEGSLRGLKFGQAI